MACKKPFRILANSMFSLRKTRGVDCFLLYECYNTLKIKDSASNKQKQSSIPKLEEPL